MKRDWILWNVLCSPEQVAADERMEQIKKNGYCWSYRLLILVIGILAFLLRLFSVLTMADGSHGMVPAESLWHIFIMQCLQKRKKEKEQRCSELQLC